MLRSRVASGVTEIEGIRRSPAFASRRLFSIVTRSILSRSDLPSAHAEQENRGAKEHHFVSRSFRLLNIIDCIRKIVSDRFSYIRGEEQHGVP